MARFVLVHGAFGGTWAWERVAPLLRDAGHEAEVVELPGAGSDPTPVAEGTLSAYAQRICTVVGDGPPAVLVGQSMGGMAITQAAARRPELVAALAYVAAFLPVEGESLVDLAGAPERGGWGGPAEPRRGGRPAGRADAGRGGARGPVQLRERRAGRLGRAAAGTAAGGPVHAAFLGPRAGRGVRRAAAGVRDMPPGPRDPPASAAPDVHPRPLRP